MRLDYTLGLACGLALATSAAARQAPQPAAQPGKTQPEPVNPFPVPVYRMNDVSKSLNLTPEQIASLNKLTDQTQTRFRDDFAKLATLAEAERFTRMQELNRLYATDWNKAARDVFNDTQRTRYQQLDYQFGGFNALYDPDVQKRLGLTPDQVKNLRAHWDWSNQQMQEINRVGAADAAKGARQFDEYWKQRQERIDKFLTAEQQKAWRELIGDPYTFRPTFAPPR
jgi:Spy/CpxP family protein refolding chaperone